MKCFLLLLIVLVFYSCNLFKNTHSSGQDLHQQLSSVADANFHEDKNWLNKSNAITWQRDTGNKSYTVQLWPKGSFTFSPEYGFSGEAEKVLLTGNAETGSSYVNQRSHQMSDKGKIDVQSHQKGKMITDEREITKTSSPSWKWVVAGLVLLLALFGIAYINVKHLKIF